MSERTGLLGELWAFLKVRKKWWIGPIVLFVAALTVLILVAERSQNTPFIYDIF